MPAPAEDPLPPAWSQLVISVVVGALVGLLWSLWQGDMLRWVVIGTAVGLLSGVWAEMRLARRKRERED